MIAATPRAPPTWLLVITFLVLANCSTIEAWVTTGGSSSSSFVVRTRGITRPAQVLLVGRTSLLSSTEKQQEPPIAAAAVKEEELVYDYEAPEDAVIHIQPRAMNRLRELRAQQFQTNKKEKDPQPQPQYLVLRMGVRNGGCSGMSYVMDFAQPESINTEEDTVDTYEDENIQCVVDSKSLLYLYGLELDYSNELVGGGFRFKNPNAEESCGCGSSFAV